MDEKPFLEFDITKLRENMIGEVAKFHKSNFDVDKIISNASLLKYLKGIRKTIDAELVNPSPDFVKFFANQNYSGRITAPVLEQFTELVQRAFNQMISEKVNERLTNALTKESEKEQAHAPVPPKDEEEESKVITTEEEMEGFRIVQAILRRRVSKERIVGRDTQSYFGVLLDDNNRKPLCRLRFNSSKKYLGVFDKDKNESKIALESVDDIYLHEDVLLATIDFYEKE